jgi:hypothetical protein
MSAIKLATPSSGSISLSPANTASNLTITVPAVTGTMITTASTFAGTGPAFSAYLASNQSISTNTWTKVQTGTESFDTASCFDTSTYRFTPNVAGYYQVNGRITSFSNGTIVICTVYKNGSENIRLTDLRVSFTGGTSGQGSCLIYLNGTTDYIELYGNISGGSTNFEGGDASTYFQAFLARAA